MSRCFDCEIDANEGRDETPVFTLDQGVPRHFPADGFRDQTSKGFSHAGRVVRRRFCAGVDGEGKEVDAVPGQSTKDWPDGHGEWANLEPWGGDGA